MADRNVEAGGAGYGPKWGYMFGGALLVLAVALLLPAIQSPHGTSPGKYCRHNIQQICLALLSYENTYGCLPPAYVADAEGKPMHSWRVLILPFLDQGSLYKKYDFGEPWNGPHNRLLAEQIADVYRCPAGGGRPTDTNYLAVVDRETAWPGRRMRTRDITDGPLKTIAIVEVADSGIEWLEPRDMTMTEALQGINPSDAGLAISSPHEPGGAYVGFFDGHASFVSNGLTADLLGRMLTPAGGEEVSIPENE